MTVTTGGALDGVGVLVLLVLPVVVLEELLELDLLLLAGIDEADLGADLGRRTARSSRR